MMQSIIQPYRALRRGNLNKETMIPLAFIHIDNKIPKHLIGNAHIAVQNCSIAKISHEEARTHYQLIPTLSEPPIWRYISRKILGAQKTTISILEKIENGPTFRPSWISVSSGDEFREILGAQKTALAVLEI